MENIWFTSDHHLGHSNIIGKAERPFKSVEEMDEELIKRWNSKIEKDDIVYYLGDLSFCQPEKYLDLLNGKIFFILGNHEFSFKRHGDKANEAVKYIKKHPKVIECKKEHYFSLDGYDIKLNHFPNKEVFDEFKGNKILLFGHAHGKQKERFNTLDVGVDTNDFFPYSWEDIKKIIKEKIKIK